MVGGIAGVPLSSRRLSSVTARSPPRTAAVAAAAAAAAAVLPAAAAAARPCVATACSPSGSASSWGAASACRFSPGQRHAAAALAGAGGECAGARGAAWVCHATRPARKPPLRMRAPPPQPEDGAESGGATGDEDLALKEAEQAAAAALLPGVVRVTCVQDLPRFDMPLLLGTFRSSTCNAVAVSHGGQRYLLAPSAAVAYGSQVRVYLPGREKPFPARVAHLGVDCELAALELIGSSSSSSSGGGSSSSSSASSAAAAAVAEFWGALQPYELAAQGLPALQERVGVVSYAEAQPQPRLSPGTVMRTEVITYPSALQRLLGLTVAVAIGKEQLGSAVVDARGQCLGIVFGRTVGSGSRKGGGAGAGAGSGGSGGGGSDSRWGQGRRRVGRRRGRRGQQEASALVVPVPVVAHFLDDIQKHGRCLGFPTLGIQWRRTESPALRRYTGMAPEQTGVAIVSINPTAGLAAAGGEALDVLAAVGDAAVGNDGTVAFRGGDESINISYHISQFQVGDTLELTLLRRGAPLTLPLQLGVPARLLPLHLAGAPPQWLVVSGLVLTVLSGPFLEGAFGRGWAVRAPVQLLREWHNHPSSEDEQVVVVAECQDMGPGTATDGYERRAVMHQRVLRCNGQPVRNLRHLTLMVAEAVADATIAPAAAAAAAASASAAPADAAAGALTSDAAGITTMAAAASRSSPATSTSSTSSAGPSHTSSSSGSGSGSGSGPPLHPSYITLELSSRLVMVLPVESVVEDTREMLSEYEVAHPVSEDLRAEYEGTIKARRQQLAATEAAEKGVAEKGGRGKGKGRGGRGGKAR
ncbi:hypothetical protein HXX76_006402 [Chlamydomonas incerta]|uniref:Protease Do-like PDZ domain-containing protein n=1 Tax=Chlamydomonas incerta TaxID=51695 RepID=A0A835T132_CHLIN|nr:hypothetical protein HXX76_006402 [Chlamydomonas incerta]|eukprot:KAG2436883.1 hypothetical protein HXX76_006402 [Chlamydomonas incerta]